MLSSSKIISRSVSLDFLKFVLAVLIVNFHYEFFVSGRPYSILLFLGYYAIPIFLILSFYFNSKYYITARLNFAVLLHKIIRYLYPFLFWSAIGFSLHLALISPKNLILQLFFGTIVNPPLYYLVISITIYSVQYILVFLPLKVRIALFYTIIVLSLIFETLFNYQNLVKSLPAASQYTISHLFEYLKYAFFGSLLYYNEKNGKYKFVNFLKNKYFSSLILLFTVILLLINYYLRFKVSQFGYSGLMHFFSVIFLFLCFYALKRLKFYASLTNFFTFLGRYSFGIYCFHFLMIERVMVYKNSLINAGIAVQILIVAFIVICCLFLSFLLDKTSNGKLRLLVN